MGTSRRLGLVIGAASTGVWDVVSAAPDDVQVVALFERGDQVWSDLHESLAGDLECHEIDTAAGLAALDLDGVTTFADDKLVLTARLAASTGLRFHTERTASLLVDKGLQRDSLAGSGIGVRHRVAEGRADVEAALAALGGPCLLKPVSGWASRGVLRLRAGEPLPTEFDLPAVVEEEIAHGPHPRHAFLADYFSVESVMVDGVATHVGITGRFPVAHPFREAGVIMPAELPPEVAARSHATVDRALALLGATEGTFHTELKMGPGGQVVVIEVNGRLGGFVDGVAKMTTGQSLLAQSMAASLGEPGRPLPAPPRAAAVLFVHPADEPVVQEGALPVALLREVPGMTRVHVRSHDGSVIDPREGTNAAVAFCWLLADDVPALGTAASQVVDLIRREVSFHPVARR